MRLYLKYASIVLRSHMQYKASFAMLTIGQFLVAFTAFLGVYFLFNRLGAVGGFGFGEVLICFAVMLAAFSLAELFFRGFDVFPSVISNGEFDRIMVRPRGEIFQVLASRIEFTKLGRLLQAFLVLIIAIPVSGVVWTGTRVLTLVLMLVCGTVVFCALFLLYAGICFFTLDGLEVMNIFTDGGREFGKYPFSIYGDGILKFFTYVIPLALFQYYPLLYLTGRSDNPLYMLLPIISTLFAIPCYAFWRFGISRYKSTGS